MPERPNAAISCTNAQLFTHQPGAAGLAAIIVGYVLLAGGSTVGAPLLLVLGYAVLIPLGIIC